jgi:hypothetical protein
MYNFHIYAYINIRKYSKLYVPPIIVLQNILHKDLKNKKGGKKITKTIYLRSQFWMYKFGLYVYVCVRV